MGFIVAATFPDGVILGADTSVNLPGPPKGYDQPLPQEVTHGNVGGVLKVFEGRETLVPLGHRPIGVAIYGTPLIGDRSVGSYFREFVVSDPNGVISGETEIQVIAEELNKFFAKLHKEIVLPSSEVFHKKPYDQIPANERPGFGFVLGGYSANSYMGEIWQVFVPVLTEAVQLRKAGEYSINWFGNIEPIDRYLKGYSQGILNELRQYIEKGRGIPFSDQEQRDINAILARAEYILPITAMPVEVGTELVRFLVELTINHFRFALGAAFVAGEPRIGKASYMGTPFEIL
ncbi:hypothetical protein [Candidatus Binatus sp.]|jgi:hypothetical protein|uniref:hypothetical protein n=1 Tax=Candidatus Binatus sp. TaxID=2811406 RepID=UPI003BD4F62D